MSEAFPPGVLVASKKVVDTNKEMSKFTDNCAIKPVYKELKGLTHFNQTDYAMIMPCESYWVNLKRMPDSNYRDHYLLWAWLAMDFLKKENLVSNAAAMYSVKSNLARVVDLVK